MLICCRMSSPFLLPSVLVRSPICSEQLKVGHSRAGGCGEPRQRLLGVLLRRAPGQRDGAEPADQRQVLHRFGLQAWALVKLRRARLLGRMQTASATWAANEGLRTQEASIVPVRYAERAVTNQWSANDPCRYSCMLNVTCTAGSGSNCKTMPHRAYVPRRILSQAANDLRQAGHGTILHKHQPLRAPDGMYMTALDNAGHCSVTVACLGGTCEEAAESCLQGYNVLLCGACATGCSRDGPGA